MTHFLGIDGGGTRTTVALADAAGTELCRRTGAAGIVDPRWPLAAAESVIGLVREVLAAGGVTRPVEALCAGLAGTGDPAGRALVQGALEGAGLARWVEVCSDGEIALEGALLGRAGVLLVAGTGSVAWGRSEDGRVERCGGWGSIAGDEGSAYWLGRAALQAALRAHDGRGPATRLLEEAMRASGTVQPEQLPAWAGRVPKADIAALARRVVALASEGDAVAVGLVEEAAEGLAEHVAPLIRRLGPWRGAVTVVLHGGLGEQPSFAQTVGRRLREMDANLSVERPAADAVTGALLRARREAAHFLPD